MLVDAASTPARCAAVLAVDGQRFYTDGVPGPSVMKRFRGRGDNQILSLEILAIAVALSTFASLLSGRSVLLYSDNTGKCRSAPVEMYGNSVCLAGAEKATTKGSARAFDHNQLVHEIWYHAYLCKIRLWVERVPSKENISDLPSRFHYVLVRDKLKAEWRKPVLASLYLGN